MIGTIVVGVIVLLFGVTAFFGAPYVPSQRRYLRRAFDHFELISSRDLLVDIGAGDGRVLRQASARGARAIGYEINPLLAGLASWLSRRDENVAIIMKNFWTSPLPDATTIVYAFSVKRDEKRLIKKLTQEAVRLQRPLTLLCLGSPLETLEAEAKFEAYTLYRFHPIQRKALTV